jgi:hypothetical protein
MEVNDRILYRDHHGESIHHHSISWNYLTLLDGLLVIYEVAREFEFTSLRQHQRFSGAMRETRACAKAFQLFSASR